MGWRTTNYPKVDITDKMWEKACTALLAFRWRYRIRGCDKIELNDNSDLKKVLKALWNIRVCTRYLDYSLILPLDSFLIMVLNYYERAPSQYTVHFYLILSRLEDINNTIGYCPLSMNDTRNYFYVKSVGFRYMIFKWSYRKHIYLMTTKIHMNFVLPPRSAGNTMTMICLFKKLNQNLVLHLYFKLCIYLTMLLISNSFVLVLHLLPSWILLLKSPLHQG